MRVAAWAFRFDWRDPVADEKRALLADLAARADDAGMALTLCGQPELLVDGVAAARSLDAGRPGEWAGQ